MDSIEQLTAIFERFPGIGPRQSERFVQFLLRSSAGLRRELIGAVQDLSHSVHQCPQCFRFSSGARGICSVCASAERDRSLLAVIANDIDLIALERIGIYRGLYFVLGGTISLASEKIGGLRIKQLLESIPARASSGLKEIILAFPANPEGDATAIRVREELAPFYQGRTLVVTSLGRGLSTGSELEYADPDTIRNALATRK